MSDDRTSHDDSPLGSPAPGCDDTSRISQPNLKNFKEKSVHEGRELPTERDAEGNGRINQPNLKDFVKAIDEVFEAVDRAVVASYSIDGELVDSMASIATTLKRRLFFQLKKFKKCERPECGQTFAARRRDQRYCCSDKCREYGHRKSAREYWQREHGK